MSTQELLSATVIVALLIALLVVINSGCATRPANDSRTEDENWWSLRPQQQPKE